ncbi:MAG: TetR/AcrR family transcriptional regulator C-terminal domain-containing protein [Kineosporiaceae bacterium]|nr:TetR/AcrR family transcriptional regulator C-terminal domain-containing protein [Kineosporiaceae bacterium]
MSELPRYLHLMWGREPAGRRGPRPTRTITEIGRAAVELADAAGLEAVTMKSVAEAIGFTTMSLYRYLDSKDELFAVMLDVAAGPPPQPDVGQSWRSALTTWARDMATHRLAHPWMLQISPGSPPLTPNMLAWTDAGLACLATTPLTAAERFSSLLAVDAWAAQHVRQSLQFQLIGPRKDDAAAVSYAVNLATLVDPERLPALWAAAQEALQDNDHDEDFFEDEFARGLALLLDGVQAMIHRRL